MLARPLRAIEGQLRPPGPEEKHLTDDQLRSKYAVASLDDLETAAQLRYVFRVVRVAPPQLRALLRGDEAWRARVVQVCTRLRSVVAPKLDALPPPASSLQAWEQSWLDFPSQWGALVKLFLRKVASQPQPPAVARRQLAAVPPSGEWLCFLCGEEFSTISRLKQHQAAKHGRRQLGFYQVTGSICPSCGADYRSRARLLTHLGPKGSRVCAAAVSALPRLSDAAVYQNNVGDASDRRACRAAGIDRSRGPPRLLPAAGDIAV